MDLYLSLFVLICNAVLWWVARRDLSARAAQSLASDREELERLRAAVESLTAELERRAAEAEERLVRRIHQAEGRGISSELPPPPRPLDESDGRSREADSAERYHPVFELAASGITDPTEIARRTGLGRGEVELLLNLRSRRAL